MTVTPNRDSPRPVVRARQFGAIHRVTHPELGPWPIAYRVKNEGNCEVRNVEHGVDADGVEIRPSAFLKPHEVSHLVRTGFAPSDRVVIARSVATSRASQARSRLLRPFLVRSRSEHLAQRTTSAALESARYALVISPFRPANQRYLQAIAGSRYRFHHRRSTWFPGRASTTSTATASKHSTTRMMRRSHTGRDKFRHRSAGSSCRPSGPQQSAGARWSRRLPSRLAGVTAGSCKATAPASRV